MNFQILQQRLARIKEIAAMSRNVEIDGVICHVMGMIRRDDHILQMLVLEYDESYREKLEEGEIADLTDLPVEPTTNRIEQRSDRKLRPKLHFHSVERVCIGNLD